MPARITLTFTQGKLTGKTIVFEERTTCIIGRGKDCYPRIPNEKDHETISRHHCLLDINPPDIRIRDFGSLNGIYVNGTKIGQREPGQMPEEAAQGSFPEHDLKEGDEIRLGSTVLCVSLFIPTFCAECGAEIPEDEQGRARRIPGGYQCEACLRKAEQARRKEPPMAKPKVCAGCGKDVSSEMGMHQQGEFLCTDCRADPGKLIKRLVELANRGNQPLKAIQGYRLLHELGRGGTGAVYLAQNDRTGKQVALKIMLPKIAADERAKAQFLRETENTRALKHCHVVELQDSGCVNGTFFFTLEYCDGGNAMELIKKRGGILPIDEACLLILQALDGLQYAHNAEIPYVVQANGIIVPGRGLVHRDVKPSNLFLVGPGRAPIVKVGDYGLAKAFDLAGLSGQTRTGETAGTPYFMPRQQVINFRHVKPEVDVWAAAASLYSMLTGTCARDFSQDGDPWYIILQTAAVPIRQRNVAIPKRLADVIDHALVDHPQIGFKTAIEFKQALESVL